MKSLTASTLSAPKYLLCIFAILLACAIAGCALYGAWMGAFLLAEVAFHSLTLFGGGGEMEVDAEIIRYSTNLRSSEIKWSEITSVETTPSAMVFRSHNKRLRLPTKRFEESGEFAPISEYIQGQIRAWNIPQHVLIGHSIQRPPLSS
jgi:hypothetical protein